MFGKVNPAPAVSKSIRIVFKSLPEPLKPPKTIKKEILIHIYIYIVSGDSAPAPPLPVGLKASEKSAFWPSPGLRLMIAVEK